MSTILQYLFTYLIKKSIVSGDYSHRTCQSYSLCCKFVMSVGTTKKRDEHVKCCRVLMVKCESVDANEP